MSIDLSYKNKYGISLQDVLGVLLSKPISKKEIKESLSTETNIDLLLKKLEEASLIEKQKEGIKILYLATSNNTKKSNAKKKKNESTSKKTNDDLNVEEIEISAIHLKEEIESDDSKKLNPDVAFRKAIKANPKKTRPPVEVERINKQTEVISEKHQITSLVEVDETKQKKVSKSVELNEADLQTLKSVMETKLGKEVTAVLHKRNERVLKERKKTAQEIFESEQKKLEAASESYNAENPYRFLLNFFTTTINGETATPYFRRRDEYVVKSIYNKFKSLCNVVENYDLSMQNLPFYRVLTINLKERKVKMYHISMDRVVRGITNLFELSEEDIKYITFEK